MAKFDNATIARAMLGARWSALARTGLDLESVGRFDPSLLRESRVAAGTPEQRDLWHNGWSLLAIVGLLAAEWLSRRRAGLS